MRTLFTATAKAELREAIAYYTQEESPSLGQRFANVIEASIAQIQQSPFLPRSRKGGYRRFNCRTFPYYIAYTITDETILVLAIAHERRRPDYRKFTP
jgi:plasmid stabilization system protein ParE